MQSINERIDYIEDQYGYYAVDEESPSEVISKLKSELEYLQELKEYIERNKCFQSALCRDELLGSED